MAPKKKHKEPSPKQLTSPRVTRSATVAKRAAEEVAAVEAPAEKKAKVAAEKEKGKGKGKGKGKAAVEVEGKPKVAVEGKGKAKASDDDEKQDPPPAGGDTDLRNVVIEACTQCRSFKERALKVKEGLESALPGIIVRINPEKPRRGCFEIRLLTGEIFLSLQDLKRPFTGLKKLDMDKVVKDVVKEIQSRSAS